MYKLLEELEFDLPEKKLKEIKAKFCMHLNQYRNFISTSIKSKNGVVKYKDFDNIDYSIYA